MWCNQLPTPAGMVLNANAPSADRILSSRETYVVPSKTIKVTLENGEVSEFAPEEIATLIRNARQKMLPLEAPRSQPVSDNAGFLQTKSGETFYIARFHD